MSEANSTFPQVPDVEFRSIEWLPGYAFGSDGTVWTRWRRHYKHALCDVWRQLKGSLTTYKGKWADNYRETAVRGINDKKRRNHMVHKLILEAFVGPRPEGMECRHLNGNGSDNRIANLRWGTPAENTLDKFRHGTVSRGCRNGWSKLNEEKVLEMRQRRKNGEQLKSLAAYFKVDVRTVTRVVGRRIWTHI